MCKCAWLETRRIHWVPCSTPPLITIERQSLSLNVWLTVFWLGSLMGKFHQRTFKLSEVQAPPSSPSTGLQESMAMINVLQILGCLNSGPHAYAASAFTHCTTSAAQGTSSEYVPNGDNEKKHACSRYKFLITPLYKRTLFQGKLNSSQTIKTAK